MDFNNFMNKINKHATRDYNGQTCAQKSMYPQSQNVYMTVVFLILMLCFTHEHTCQFSLKLYIYLETTRWASTCMERHMDASNTDFVACCCMDFVDLYRSFHGPYLRRLSRQCFSDNKWAGVLWGSWWTVGSDWVGLGWGLRFCVPNRLSGVITTGWVTNTVVSLELMLGSSCRVFFNHPF